MLLQTLVVKSWRPARSLDVTADASWVEEEESQLEDVQFEQLQHVVDLEGEEPPPEVLESAVESLARVVGSRFEILPF
ncbi:hypothetical protein IEQ34_019538 [Dendrobium chrysotoxum]|uniref:Uncharacterized protein n=1 Tax=Dendrobium chrysotoxum TaxID=161865 RepID=A0AAV7G931_DENCH|nr:hypothetical protein IEQ34_019538 [Dendrobium chrysotoxum]